MKTLKIDFDNPRKNDQTIIGKNNAVNIIYNMQFFPKVIIKGFLDQNQINEFDNVLMEQIKIRRPKNNDFIVGQKYNVKDFYKRVINEKKLIYIIQQQ